MDNLSIYNAVREVPKEALKEIQAGRLKGKSDINPMWRIKILTEQFGICGLGWKYEIVKMWLENGGKDEQSAFVQINLYIRQGEQWSEAIPGVGGSSFVASEKSGLYTSDECFKMALTDAISVACKALGVAADIYWDKDKTKYDERPQEKSQEYFCTKCKGKVADVTGKNGTLLAKDVFSQTGGLCWKCYKAQKEATNG